MAFLAAGTGAAAESHSVHLFAAGETPLTGEAEVIAAPVEAGPGDERPTDPPADATLRQRVAAPGTVDLQLPAGRWSITARLPGFWFPSVEVDAGTADDGESPVVQLPGFPAAVLRGRLSPPRGADLPPRLAVLLAATEVGLSRRAPGGRAPCELSDGTAAAGPGGDGEPAGETGSFRCALPAGTLDLTLLAPPYAPLNHYGLTLPAGETIDLGELPLRQGGSVRGRVVGRDSGAGVAGARVNLLPEAAGLPTSATVHRRLQQTNLETSSDEEGFFALSGVAPGRYRVVAEAAGYAVAAPPEAIEVAGGSLTELPDPIALPRPVTLRVELEPPVDPWGDPWVVSLNHDPRDPVSSGNQEAPADRQGRWRASGVVPGRYGLTVSSPDGNRWHDEQLDLAPEQPPLLVTLPLLEVIGRVESGGVPVAADVLFGGVSGARRVRMASDDDGRFAGYLPAAGSWRIDVAPREAEGLVLALPEREIEEAPGRGRARVIIELPDTRIEGEVVDETGLPVADAEVTSFGFEARRPSSLTADEDGFFRFRGLPPGRHGFQARQGGRESLTELVELEEGLEPPSLRLVLRSRTTVRGRLLGPGGPVAGGRIIALPDLSSGAGGTMATALSGPDGGFQLEITSQPFLDLVVLAPGLPLHIGRFPFSSEEELTVPLTDQGGSMVLRAAGPPGRPPAGSLRHAGASVPLALLIGVLPELRSQLAAGSDNLTLPAMAAGEYELCVRAQDAVQMSCERGTLLPYGELLLAPGSTGDGDGA